MTTTPDNRHQQAAIVDHESWSVPAIFLGIDADLRARAFLLEQTALWRDGADFEGTDEDWIDICLDEGWSLVETNPDESNWEL